MKLIRSSLVVELMSWDSRKSWCRCQGRTEGGSGIVIVVVILVLSPASLAAKAQATLQLFHPIFESICLRNPSSVLC
jgi:hypothetical protein